MEKRRKFLENVPIFRKSLKNRMTTSSREPNQGNPESAKYRARF
jgi:hypothetical protein